LKRIKISTTSDLSNESDRFEHNNGLIIETDKFKQNSGLRIETDRISTTVDLSTETEKVNKKKLKLKTNYRLTSTLPDLKLERIEFQQT